MYICNDACYKGKTLYKIAMTKNIHGQINHVSQYQLSADTLYDLSALRTNNKFEIFYIFLLLGDDMGVMMKKGIVTKAQDTNTNALDVNTMKTAAIMREAHHTNTGTANMKGGKMTHHLWYQIINQNRQGEEDGVLLPSKQDDKCTGLVDTDSIKLGKWVGNFYLFEITHSVYCKMYVTQK